MSSSFPTASHQQQQHKQQQGQQPFSNIMMQPSSNGFCAPQQPMAPVTTNNLTPSNAGLFAIPTVTDSGMPMFTVEQLQQLQRQMMRQNQQQNQQQQQNQLQQQQNQRQQQNWQQQQGTSNQQQSPVVVIAQVPYSSLMAASQQQQQENGSMTAWNNDSRSCSSNNNNNSGNPSAQQLKQQQHPQQISFQQQQIQVQQQMQMQQQMQANNSNNNNNNSSNNNNPFVQQLLRNAQSAAQQAHLSPMSTSSASHGTALMNDHSQNTINQSMGKNGFHTNNGEQQQQRHLYTLGSLVEPLPKSSGSPSCGMNDNSPSSKKGGALPSSQSTQALQEAVLWKQFWDENSKGGSVGSGGKRKHDDPSSHLATIKQEASDDGDGEEENIDACFDEDDLEPAPLDEMERHQDQSQIVHISPSGHSMQTKQPSPMQLSCQSSSSSSGPQHPNSSMPMSQQQQMKMQQQFNLQAQQAKQQAAAAAVNASKQKIGQKQDPQQMFHQLQQSTASPMAFALPNTKGEANTHPSSSMSISNNSSGSIARSFSSQLPQEIGARATTSASNSTNGAAATGASSAFLLPSTMLAPSVLTSVLMMPTSKGSSRSISTVGKTAKTPNSPSVSDEGSGKRSRKKSNKTESPQHVLERILVSRGYGTSAAGLRIKADQANYDTLPSPLQLASFGTELVKAIHTSDCTKLSKLLNLGLSANPCNQFRDSIIDLVCKRANAEIFLCLVEHGSELKVCDGFGRTPLHHCCWASQFCRRIAETILQIDWKQLLIEDKRGQTPLEYLRADQADDWIDFLEENQDLYFPRGGTIPVLHNLKESRADGYLPDPPNALPVQLASAVSAGQLTPEEVETLSPEMRARFQ